MTWVKGKHILHFGGELLMEQDNSTPWGGINGATVSFTGQYTTSNPPLRLAMPTFCWEMRSHGIQTPHQNTTGAKNPSFFAQDDFKIRPNLTINFGVRSETHGGASEKYNNAGGFDPTIADPLGATYTSGATTYFLNPQGSIWFAGENGARTRKLRDQDRSDASSRLRVVDVAEMVFRGGVGQFASRWSEDTVGGPMGFGSGSVGSASNSSTTTPVVQLSGSGANLPVLTGAAARNPLSYITPANPQGSSGTIPLYPPQPPHSERLAMDSRRPASFAWKPCSRGAIRWQPLGKYDVRGGCQPATCE